MSDVKRYVCECSKIMDKQEYDRYQEAEHRNFSWLGAPQNFSSS